MSQAWIYTFVYIAWLIGAACFVLGLHQMNSPATARNGNRLSASGMVVAVGATLVQLILRPEGLSAAALAIIVIGFLIGGGAGLYTARTVKMTAMPQLVSLFNAVGGGAAALVAIDDFIRLTGAGGADTATTIFVVLGAIFGSVTFTGSLIAGGKLQGLIPGKPIVVPGGRILTIAIAAVAVIGTAVLVLAAAGSPDPRLLGRPRRPGPDRGGRPDLRDHDGPADRRGRHAGRDQPPERPDRNGRGDGRLRDRQPGPDHRRSARRCVRIDPDQPDGNGDEPIDPEHPGRRLRYRRFRRPGPRPAELAGASARSRPTTRRSSWRTPRA